MRILSFLFLLLTAPLSLAAQQTLADFTVEGSRFESSGQNSHTRFGLLASPEAAAHLQAEAAKYDYIRADIQPLDNQRFICDLYVTGQPEAAYVQKLFISFGIEGVQTSGGRLEVSECVSFLESF